MAFKTVNNSEFAHRPLYIGYAPIKVHAVNVDSQELEKYFGPQQTGTNYFNEMDINGKATKSVRIEFIISIDKKEPVSYYRLSFFLSKAYAQSPKGSVQVIDEFGRNYWFPKDDVTNKRIPVFANDRPADISKDYHPAIVGEVKLNSFIRALCNLNDPNYFNSQENTWKLREGDDLERCKGSLDCIKDYFDGDFSELKAIVDMAKDNTVYALFGIKTNADGRQFQTIYTDKFVRATRRENNVASDFDKAILAYQPKDTEFSAEPLKEYIVPTTDFSKIGSPAPAPNTSATPPAATAPVDDFPFDMGGDSGFGDF